MIIKDRSKSLSHCILESLYARDNLSSTARIKYESQKKGLEGELEFDHLIQEANLPGLIICDLLLSTKDTHFQIDALYITDGHIYLYEIKNYSGSQNYKDGFIYSESGYAVQNPIAQVERKQSYLHNLILNMGHQIELSSYVIFINAEFYLYSFPETPQVIFSGQIQNHFSQLSKNSRKVSSKTQTLSNRLLSMHVHDYRPTNLPDYTFYRLKKGIYCPNCLKYDCHTTRQFRICPHCNNKEKSAEAIKRTLREFRRLFPNEKLTRKIANEWCGLELPSNRIKSALVKNFELHHSGRSSYYT